MRARQRVYGFADRGSFRDSAPPPSLRFKLNLFLFFFFFLHGDADFALRPSFGDRRRTFSVRVTVRYVLVRSQGRAHPRDRGLERYNCAVFSFRRREILPNGRLGRLLEEQRFSRDWVKGDSIRRLGRASVAV